MIGTATALDRSALLDWYRRNRQRSRQLFDLVRPEAYYSRPIALRHPIVFYEGHLPAFSVNALVKKGLGRPGVDDALERLFARGIDPEDEADASRSRRTEWPAREEVQRFADACDALVLDALANAPIEQQGHPLLHDAQAAYAILEHEAMHQETMLYMWHQLPCEHKQAPAGAAGDVSGATPAPACVTVPAGRATLGARPGEIRFGWDNEFPGAVVDVPAFAIDVHDVTNEQFLAFVDAGGYQRPELWTPSAFAWLQAEGIAHPQFWSRHDRTWRWRGMFDEIRPAAGLARLREPRRGRRVRPVGGRAAADRSGIPPGGVRPPVWPRAAASVGRRTAGRVARSVRLQVLESRRGRTAPRRPERLGRARPGRQRLGVDVDGVRAVRRLPRRWRRTPSTRQTSSTASTS